MRWVVHGERAVYASPWVSVALVDVQVPGGERFEHHVVWMPGDASGVVAVAGGGVQMGDALIAASAIESANDLATFTSKHFPGLSRVVKPDR
jgi:ribosomal protein S5